MRRVSCRFCSSRRARLARSRERRPRGASENLPYARIGSCLPNWVARSIAVGNCLAKIVIGGLWWIKRIIGSGWFAGDGSHLRRRNWLGCCGRRVFGFGLLRFVVFVVRWLVCRDGNRTALLFRATCGFGAAESPRLRLRGRVARRRARALGLDGPRSVAALVSSAPALRGLPLETWAASAIFLHRPRSDKLSGFLPTFPAPLLVPASTGEWRVPSLCRLSLRLFLWPFVAAAFSTWRSSMLFRLSGRIPNRIPVVTITALVASAPISRDAMSVEECGCGGNRNDRAADQAALGSAGCGCGPLLLDSMFLPMQSAARAGPERRSSRAGNRNRVARLRRSAHFRRIGFGFISSASSVLWTFSIGGRSLTAFGQQCADQAPDFGFSPITSSVSGCGASIKCITNQVAHRRPRNGG